jgi:hypothetical protein
MPFIKIKNCKNCNVPHDWFFDSLDLQELRMVKKLVGLRANEFGEAMDDMDPDAIAAMLFVLHKRNGIIVPFDDVNLDFRDLDIQATEEEEAELAELEKRMQDAADGAQSPKITKSGPKGKAD